MWSPEHGEEALDAHLCVSRVNDLALLRVNDQRGKPLILGLFLRRDAREKAAAVRRSLSASLRPSPTNYESRARAPACRGSKRILLASALQDASTNFWTAKVAIVKSLVNLRSRGPRSDYRITFCVARVTVPAAQS